MARQTTPPCALVRLLSGFHAWLYMASSSVTQSNSMLSSCVFVSTLPFDMMSSPPCLPSLQVVLGHDNAQHFHPYPRRLPSISTLFPSQIKVEMPLFHYPRHLNSRYESHSPTTSSSAASIDDNDDPALLEVPGQCLDPSCREPVKHRGFCKAHGGSRRCAVVGCTKGVQGGSLCIGHGGGKRCRIPDCNKATQSQGLCKAHGGGVRCKFEGCTKSSQGGGFCRRHGGGKRCSVEGCPRGAQRGSTCAQHGGKSRCLVDDCVRADRGGGYCEVHRRNRVCRVGFCNRLAKVRCNGYCAQHHREHYLRP